MNYEYMFLGVRSTEPHTQLDKGDQAIFNYTKLQHEYNRWSDCFNRYQRIYKKEYVFDPVNIVDIVLDAPQVTWHMYYGRGPPGIDTRKDQTMYIGFEKFGPRHLWEYKGEKGEVLIFTLPEREDYRWSKDKEWEYVFIPLSLVPDIIQKYLDLDESKAREGKVNKEFHDFYIKHKYVADAFKQFREYVLSVATLINEKDVIYVGKE